MPILAALFCFVVAAVAAITTNLPQLYRGVTELDVLARAKEQNHKKGEALALAIRAEIAAVYFLAVAVGAILLD